jgi:hypothetical protein
VSGESNTSRLEQGLLARFRDWLRRSATDVIWFGISVGVAMASVATALAWTEGRQAGVPAIFFALSVVIGLTRLITTRIAAAKEAVISRLDETTKLHGARIDTLAQAIDETRSALAELHDLSPLALVLWDKSRFEHSGRIRTLREGELYFGAADEALEHFKLTVNAAQSSIHALDHIDPRQWFENVGWNRHLMEQLRRVRAGEITLERVRVVRDELLGDADYVQPLIALVNAHEDAGATMILCPESGLREMKTYFHPSRGMLLIDRDERPACVTGTVGASGLVENALLYLRKLGPVDRVLRDYDEIRERITAEQWDTALRERLGI